MRIKKYMVLFLVTALSITVITGCGKKSKTNDNNTEKTQTSEEVTKDTTNISNTDDNTVTTDNSNTESTASEATTENGKVESSLTDEILVPGEITLNGDNYKIPTTVSEFEKAGFTIDHDYTITGDVKPGADSNVFMRKSDTVWFTLNVINDSDIEKKSEECPVNGIIINYAPGELELELGNGVKLGDNRSAVDNIYKDVVMEDIKADSVTGVLKYHDRFGSTVEYYYDTASGIINGVNVTVKR